MQRTDLNLSTQPFPAYRLVNLGLCVVGAALLMLTIWQAYGFIHFSSMARDIRDDEQNAQVEAQSSGKQVADLRSRLDRPEAAATLTEIGFLNSLIARKDLSWTRLFSSLEDLVPNSVHLVNLRPRVAASGPVVLNLEVTSRSIADVSRFIEALEQSPEFEGVVVSVEQLAAQPGSSDVNVNLTTNYFPRGEVR